MELEQAEAQLDEAREGLAVARGLIARGVALDTLEVHALEVATGAYEEAAIRVGRLRERALLNEAIRDEHETWHATIFRKGRAPLAPPIEECRNTACRAFAATFDLREGVSVD